jgi:hypothetical protein
MEVLIMGWDEMHQVAVLKSIEIDRMETCPGCGQRIHPEHPGDKVWKRVATCPACRTVSRPFAERVSMFRVFAFGMAGIPVPRRCGRVLVREDDDR